MMSYLYVGSDRVQSHNTNRLSRKAVVSVVPTVLDLEIIWIVLFHCKSRILAYKSILFIWPAG